VTGARASAAALAAALLAAVGCASPPASPSVPPAGAAAPPATAGPPPASEPAPAVVDDDPPPPPPDAGTVTIKLVADARRQAHVFWGRKDLGVAPLEVKRPRGSGPIDLLVVAPGALPLHTRAFTDRDETLALRLYGDKEATGMLGWTPSPEPAATSASTPATTTRRDDKPHRR
jgi:hypothetical protein